MSRPTFRRTLAFSAAALALALATGADAQGGGVPAVYRCKQANGAIAYQDFPCKGGVAVDIKADAADPAAIERLQKQQADFDRAYAQRQAEEAAQRERQYVAPPRAPLPPQAENDYETYDQPTYFFYGGVPSAGFRNRDKMSRGRNHGNPPQVIHHQPPKPARPAPTPPLSPGQRVQPLGMS